MVNRFINHDGTGTQGFWFGRAGRHRGFAFIADLISFEVQVWRFIYQRFFTALGICLKKTKLVPN